jgi:hypothetical protein
MFFEKAENLRTMKEMTAKVFLVIARLQAIKM